MSSSLLVVEDDPVLNRLLVKTLGKCGYDVDSAASWQQARERIAVFAPDLVLLDVNLPDSTGFGPLSETAHSRSVVMLTAYGDVNQAVQAMRLGAADYLVKPVNLDELELVIRGALERRQLLAQKAACGDGPGAMIGDSPAMRRLRQLIQEVGGSDVTVLIQGESGSGKELVAQALHAASTRRDERFVAVDCTTLQETLFESELFGHERGAFTGADRRKTGLIEAAAQGTLFLDEIGEAGPAIQAKLLRVLESGRFRRVGATTDLRTDARVVAATNRDLAQRARQQLFRDDLYYRLAAFVIEVPPLRQRREDIAALAEHFIAQRRRGKGLPPLALGAEARQALERYDWPGNVRELRNVVERALILVGDAPRIAPAHLGLGGLPAPVAPAPAMAVPAPGTAEDESLVLQGEPTLEHIEREYLARLLKKYDGNRRKVADALGVSERTAYRMMDRHGYK
ncbi:MAG: sigma-54 dependent transcriptional regulator [Proteobacteria bacterium]|nr:sigma-54 dependent transcriptional regulator [Pseudomonadota bacterium]